MVGVGVEYTVAGWVCRRGVVVYTIDGHEAVSMAVLPIEDTDLTCP